MDQVFPYIPILLIFAIISVASNQIAKIFQYIKLPLITGFILFGILCGPFFLGLLETNQIPRLYFVNDIALAFIAFSAGAELYLKELRGRIKSIQWMTIGQLGFTFILSGLIVFLIAPYFGFFNSFETKTIVAIAMLAAIIFVARSPVSAIAIINELKAKGPFTQTAIGVTVLKDVLVIILFAICMEIANVLILDMSFNVNSLLLILSELLLAFGLGYLLSRIFRRVLDQTFHSHFKGFIMLLLGYSVYVLEHFVKEYSYQHFDKAFYIEPLLICITASFIITNFSKYRREFLKIIQDFSPYIFIVFFTLAGASIDLNVVLMNIGLVLLLFAVRLITMMTGAYFGTVMAQDPKEFRWISWMPYVTQAGVAIGLATIVSNHFPVFGPQLMSIILSIIFLNQIVGPPFFKWSLLKAGESHVRGDGKGEIEYAIIFGYEHQSIMLAHQLINHGWEVKIATFLDNFEKDEMLDIIHIDDFSDKTWQALDASKAKSIITLLSDEENYNICQFAFEKYGTHELIVRLHYRFNFKRFTELEALIVFPETAIVSLMDHLVRSPIATTLFLGMDPDQDVVDMEVKNPDIHGMALRNLRIPADTIILKTQRGDQKMISTGFTRLRLGDIISVVGSVESIEKLKLKIEGH